GGDPARILDIPPRARFGPDQPPPRRDGIGEFFARRRTRSRRASIPFRPSRRSAAQGIAPVSLGLLGFIFFIGMLFAIFLGLPVSIALAVVGLLGLLYVGGLNTVIIMSGTTAV